MTNRTEPTPPTPPTSPIGPIASREDLGRPGALGAAVARLTSLAAAGAELPAERLRALASPDALDVLLRVALGRVLRRGPAGAPELGGPARWLEVAASGAASGAVPVSTTAALRRVLDDLANELRTHGAWAPETPLWWSPLPAPGALEDTWCRLAGEPGDGGVVGAPPSADDVRRGSAAGPGAGAGWLAWQDALPPDLLARIAGELASPPEQGGLDLRGAGVGRSDRRSERRSDQVRYLAGLEPDLLAGAPTLAVLIQHLLERVEAPLRRRFPERELHAPQTAMLARYAAPTTGFAPHFDNPGGADDNERALTLVLYLNACERPCRGGRLSLWPAGASAGAPAAEMLSPAGGSAVLLDARTVLHAVEPLAPGPDRWTLVLWWSELARRPRRPLVPVSAPTVAEALAAVADPPVVPGTVLFRRLDRSGAVEVCRPARARRPRVGVMATVAGGAEELGAWCRHHLDLGADHLLLVLDEGADADAGEGEGAAVEALRRDLGRGVVTVWSDPEARRRRAALAPFEGRDDLVAAAGCGTATWAVAARQSLNATAALRAAGTAGDGGLGGVALDWLVHLDGDELLYLEGAGQGGATLAEHFAAATAAGWRSVRYLNHELLLPWRPGEPARFKRNPTLAAARLGTSGWRHLVRHLGMAQDDPRPYFRAYWNGKAAVAVAPEARAAGVHGWHVAGAPDPPWVAGPSVLHFHLATAAAFRRKYLRVAAAASASDDPHRPFPPSALERTATARVRELRGAGADRAAVAEGLDALYAQTAAFEPAEIDLLEEAGLLFTPRLSHLPLPASPAPAASR